jgi:hypothetical protein
MNFVGIGTLKIELVLVIKNFILLLFNDAISVKTV